MLQNGNKQNTKKGLSRIKLLLPTFLSLGVIYYLFKDDFSQFEGVVFNGNVAIALVAALNMVFIRDAAYVVRLKILSLGKLSWKGSFNAVMLWEFASALTPTVIGGSAFAVLILKREGINMGRSVATVIITALMDELFYVLAVPTVLLFVSLDSFFPHNISNLWFESGVQTLFIGGYILTCTISLIIISALFISPRGTGKIIGLLFKLPFLNKWSYKIDDWTEDWALASDNLKGRSFQFWAGAFGSTLLSWTARFLTLNAILIAFMESIPHAEIVAKQLAMWIVMLLSPTPGSSGIAEVAFPTFIGPALTPAISMAALGGVVLFWRTLTYFIYLIIGSILVPGWLANTSRT